MSSRSAYRTKQREMLLEFLRSVSDVHITAADVCAYFKEQGAAIGQSTVYRRLERLVDEGIVHKYTIDKNSPACFKYIGAESHNRSKACFHCRCEKCGRLIHLSCEEMSEMQTHLLTEHRFKMDPIRTVIYGLCEECV